MSNSSELIQYTEPKTKAPIAVLLFLAERSKCPAALTSRDRKVWAYFRGLYPKKCEDCTGPV